VLVSGGRLYGSACDDFIMAPWLAHSVCGRLYSTLLRWCSVDCTSVMRIKERGVTVLPRILHRELPWGLSGE